MYYFQIKSLMRLRFQLNRGILKLNAQEERSPWIAGLRFLVLFVVAIVVSVKIYSSGNSDLTDATNPEISASRVAMILTSLLLYHLIAPLSTFRSSREIELPPLLSLPISPPSLLVARGAVSLLDPEILLALLPYLALVLSLGARTILLLPAAILVLTFFCFSAVIGQIPYAFVEAGFQQRWFRAAAFGLLGLVICVIIFVVSFSLGDLPEKSVIMASSQRAMMWLSTYLPSGWTAYAMAELGRGNFVVGLEVILALVALAWLLVWLSGRVLSNLYYMHGHDSWGGRRNRVASSGFLMLERIIPSETLAIFLKELIIFRRSPWWFLFFVVWPLMVVSIVLCFPFLREPSLGVLLGFACFGSLETVQGLNMLASEGDALPALFVSPVARRSILMAKNLRVLACVLVEMAIGFGAFLLLVKRLTLLPAMMLFNISTSLIALSIANIISIRIPERVGSFEFLPRLRIKSFTTWLICTIVGCIPILALLWLAESAPKLLFAICFTSLTYAVLFYYLSVGLAEKYLEKREEEILVTLS